MDQNYAESFIEQELKNDGFGFESSAMQPFNDIPFTKLHSIYDHEEYFLRKHIIGSIKEAFEKRTGQKIGAISKEDVKTGIILLGNRIRKASKDEFSQKRVVIEACPYC